MEEQNIQVYIEPSNIDYVIIKIKEETIEERGSVYEATRSAWHAKLSTAEPYKYVLSVVSGVVREVYEVEKWMQGSEDRIEFIGHDAPQYIVDYFKGKMIPEKYRVKGLASPFLYKKLEEGEATEYVYDKNAYVEPSNIDYVIIKIKEETIKERGSIYEATRSAWHAKLSTAEPYKYVLSVVSGVVREVYEVEKWQQANDDRIEFIGNVALQYIVDYFKDKMIPEKYRVKGLASPFLYKKLLDDEPTMPVGEEVIYTEPSNLEYIIIKIKQSTVEERGSVYEATRGAWHAKLSTAEPYKYVLSVVSGIVREVYEVEKWQQTGDDRIEFVGHVGSQNIRNWFVGKMIPEKYRVKGLASPFLYKKLQDGENTEPIKL